MAERPKARSALSFLLISNVRKGANSLRDNLLQRISHFRRTVSSSLSKSHRTVRQKESCGSMAMAPKDIISRNEFFLSLSSFISPQAVL